MGEKSRNDKNKLATHKRDKKVAVEQKKKDAQTAKQGVSIKK